ncbi:MAG: phosphate ABC transporter permease subunit PstC [Thaumarchaeota archaeon]|nr:phosphate ABC transporter permease subunit PstC [Nitrososphaerota archaeon]
MALNKAPVGGRFPLNGDRVLKGLVAGAAIFVIVLMAAIAYEMFVGSSASLEQFGFGFITGTVWDPVHTVYGALPYIYGTLLTSALALLFGLPISIGVAVFLVEKLKTRHTEAYLIGTTVELLAAVPSVIYGLWGLFFLSPLLKTYVEKPLHIYLGSVPIFSGTPFGLDFFTAGVILAIMIIPTISAVSRNVLNAVPNSQREAMYSLGATDWEVISKGILPFARSGLFGATILGLGRAVGETMAVTFVIGNATRISPSLFSPGYTLASAIANQFSESSSPVSTAALVELGLLLFFVALAINIFARTLLWRMSRMTKSRL